SVHELQWAGVGGVRALPPAATSGDPRPIVMRVLTAFSAPPLSSNKVITATRPKDLLWGIRPLAKALYSAGGGAEISRRGGPVVTNEVPNPANAGHRSSPRFPLGPSASLRPGLQAVACFAD